MADHIPDCYLYLAVDALRYKARVEAGQSQAPDLFDAEDTEDWQAANEIEHALNQQS
jgi:hypothetical protein